MDHTLTIEPASFLAPRHTRRADLGPSAQQDGHNLVLDHPEGLVAGYHPAGLMQPVQQGAFDLQVVCSGDVEIAEQAHRPRFNPTEDPVAGSVHLDRDWLGHASRRWGERR